MCPSLSSPVEGATCAGGRKLETGDYVPGGIRRSPGLRTRQPERGKEEAK